MHFVSRVINILFTIEFISIQRLSHDNFYIFTQQWLRMNEWMRIMKYTNESESQQGILESKELVNSTKLPFPSELPQFIEYLVCISLIANQNVGCWWWHECLEEQFSAIRDNPPLKYRNLIIHINTSSLSSLTIIETRSEILAFSRSKFVKREWLIFRYTADEHPAVKPSFMAFHVK